jgi:hypothetical protein
VTTNRKTIREIQTPITIRGATEMAIANLKSYVIKEAPKGASFRLAKFDGLRIFPRSRYSACI